MRGGPTERILRMAAKAPGGVIRWRDARDAYRKASSYARFCERADRTNYHMSLGIVLQRHFVKVEGTDGFYVLRSQTEPEPEMQEAA